MTEEVTGEIDELALDEKRALLAGRRKRLDRYGGASFAGTAAEYVHSLWHDVTIRTGRDYLPARNCAAAGTAGSMVPPGSRLPLVPAKPRGPRQGADVPHRCRVRNI
jgi:hypothetical protein